MKIWDINPSDQTVLDPAGRECPLDPMTGDYKVPSGSLVDAPPTAGANEAVRANGKSWEVVPDWRGHVYWTPDGERHDIDELGVMPPDNALSEPPAPAPRTVEELHSDIDRTAGDARERFVSPGYLVDQEYKRAEEVARSFAAAGYPASDVPSAVSSWATAQGWTAQQAADDIIATADYWYGAIDQIREIRLAGKAAVQAATADQREATAQQYIDQLNALAVS